MANFVPLEPQTSSFLGYPLSFTVGQSQSLLQISSFLLLMFLVAASGAGIIRILYALALRVGTFGEPSETSYASSKKIINTVLVTLLLMFSAVLLMLAVNPDVVTGDVNLGALSVRGGAINVGSQNPASQTGLQNSGTGSASCPNADSYKNSLASGGNVCAGATCSATVGCDTNTYASLINQEAQKQGVSASLVTVIMCRESKGNKDAPPHNNGNGTIDCGLMQINKQGSACDASDLDPATNIARGVSLIKQKYNSITQTYQGISREMMVAAAYNCCGSGNPNDASADCNTSTGFPYTLPKWGCPINPGPSNANMCFVRNYTCDVAACLSSP